MKRVKTGRNDPCPCGSGKKFKKCCGGFGVIPPEVHEEIRRKTLEQHIRESIRMQKYGEIRPQISVDFQGYKFVVVGGNLHYSKSWKFFPDFLIDYVPQVFGTDWGKVELSKPPELRHQIVHWRTKCLEFMLQQAKHEGGYYSAKPNGFMAAYLNLAYDLYVVQDNGRLDSSLLRRLKHKDQFQGARHELFAEATCLRAGFTIQHEDETDVSKRHAEFVASHKGTGQIISVEAKSRHRPGTLGYPGLRETGNEIKMSFRSLIEKAIKKNPPYSLVIFLDTNLPPRIAADVFPIDLDNNVPPKLIAELDDEFRWKHGGKDPFNAIIYTNHPHYYGREDEIDPRKQLLFLMSTMPKMPVTFPSALWSLHRAADIYGIIPNSFNEHCH